MSSIEGNLQGLGLKYLGKDGMNQIQLSEEDIVQFAEAFPTICEQLENGCILQIYKTFNHAYEATLRRQTTEKESCKEVEVLNVALFGMTAKMARKQS